MGDRRTLGAVRTGDLVAPAAAQVVTMTCTCTEVMDIDCPVHGMCAGYGHPCRCGAYVSRGGERDEGPGHREQGLE